MPIKKKQLRPHVVVKTRPSEVNKNIQNCFSIGSNTIQSNGNKDLNYKVEIKRNFCFTLSDWILSQD